MRILVGVDGSRCSEAAVRSVAQRPWPTGSEIAVATVVHTSMPIVPDPTLTGVAMHWTAVEDDRAQAPERVRRAEEALKDATGLPVSTVVLEGNPADALLAEAERWKADLLVVGSHGYGAVKRLALGSVSTRIATHAHCSVEIVRCPHAAEQA